MPDRRPEAQCARIATLDTLARLILSIFSSTLLEQALHGRAKQTRVETHGPWTMVASPADVSQREGHTHTDSQSNVSSMALALTAPAYHHPKPWPFAALARPGSRHVSMHYVQYIHAHSSFMLPPPRAFVLSVAAHPQTDTFPHPAHMCVDVCRPAAWRR